MVVDRKRSDFQILRCRTSESPREFLQLSRLKLAPDPRMPVVKLNIRNFRYDAVWVTTPDASIPGRIIKGALEVDGLVIK